MALSLNVLIVDDEPKICRLLEQIIAQLGCTVRTAADGLEALEAFDRERADVVVTDLKMPRLDGLGLIRELKQRDPVLSIVVITAYPSIEGAVEAMRCGACEFITKPFELAQIQAVLYRCQQRVSVGRQVRQGDEGAVKLDELNRRLADLNDLKSQFLAQLSHGVNTPLCLMSEWICLLSDGSLGKLAPDQQDAVDALIGAYGRLQRLLRQLVDLMQGPQLLLHRQVMPIQELVQQALEAVAAKAGARGITPAVQVPTEPLPVDVDRVRLVAALQYLLDNAVQYNRDGGQIEITAEAGGAFVIVRVRDTGVGIPPEECEKVLTPFYHLDRGFKDMSSSAGLGLTLAQRYVELHGGSLQLASEVDKGTTVTLTVPRPALSVTPPAVKPSAL